MAIKNNNFLHENEKTANKVVAQVMRISFVVFTLIYIMDIIGIFKVSMDTMTISYFSGSAMLLMPSLFVNIMKKQGSARTRDRAREHRRVFSQTDEVPEIFEKSEKTEKSERSLLLCVLMN